MVQSLVREVPLEEEMAAHSTILAWKSHGQRSLAGYSPWGCNRAGHNLTTKQQQSQNSKFHRPRKIHTEYPQWQCFANVKVTQELPG